jgi:hypothetical protein
MDAPTNCADNDQQTRNGPARFHCSQGILRTQSQSGKKLRQTTEVTCQAFDFTSHDFACC